MSRRREVRVVESIEQLGAELQVALLQEVEVLRDGEVEVDAAVGPQNATSGVAKLIWTGIGEGSGVKPPLDRPFARRQVAVAQNVGAVRPAEKLLVLVGDRADFERQVQFYDGSSVQHDASTLGITAPPGSRTRPVMRACDVWPFNAAAAHKSAARSAKVASQDLLY
jgi:hypothetical protein